MAKKRLKKDKIQANMHRTIPSKNLNIVQTTSLASVEDVKPELDTTALLGYPTKLLYRDLSRSLVLTLFLIVLLVGIFFFIRYN